MAVDAEGAGAASNANALPLASATPLAAVSQGPEPVAAPHSYSSTPLSPVVVMLEKGVPAPAPVPARFFLPSVHNFYHHAHLYLQRMPSSGQEPLGGGSGRPPSCARFMSTPAPDLLPFSPEEMVFPHAPGTSPHSTHAKNLALGLTLLVVAVLLIVFKHTATSVLVVSIGVFLVLVGALSSLLAVCSLRSPGSLAILLVSLAHVVVGAAMLANVKKGAVLLVAIFSLWILAKGFARGMMLLSSVVAVLLVVMASEWEHDLPGVLMAYDIFVSGLTTSLAAVRCLFRYNRGTSADESEPLVHPHQSATSC